LEIYPIWLLRY